MSCTSNTVMGDPCVKQFLDGYDTATMSYTGDIPCLPPDQQLDCTTFGVSTLAEITALKADFGAFVDQLANDPFSIDTLLAFNGLIQ